MLFGKYSHNLDPKNRLMIPARMREELGSKIFLLKGFDGCLSVYKEAAFENFVSKLNSLPFTQKQTRDVQRIGYSSVVELEVDKQGRIQIPAQTIAAYGISKEVVIIGVVDHIEIWSKETWDNYEKENSSKFEDIAETLAL